MAPAVFLPTEDISLLGILNSKLIWYFLTSICVVRSGGYIEVKPQYFEQIPIARMDASNEIKLTSIVEQIVSIQNKSNLEISENEKAIYKKKIEILSVQIDELVYKIYGITEEERKIIDGLNR